MNPTYFSIQWDSNSIKNNPVYIRDVESQFDEFEEEHECRICLESSGNLISVCDCKGSCKYVHKECIETWIKNFHEDDIRYNKCEICKSNYKLELLDLYDDCDIIKNTNCKLIVAMLFGCVFSILMFTLIIIIVY